MSVRLDPLEPRRLFSTYVVTTTLDTTSAASLRNAILAANAAPGADTIVFAIPNGGVQTLSLSSPLPVITDALTIDGKTQADYVDRPRIRLSGAGLPAAAIGLDLSAASCRVEGLTVVGFGTGVVVRGNNTTLALNHLGVDPAGTALDGNGIGVFVTATTGVTIGETGRGNVIGFRGTTAAPGYGIILDGASSVSVRSNRIGTNALGTAATASVGFGIYTQGTCTGTLGTPGGGNVVSGITGTGIYLGNGQLDVQANLVGTAADAIAPLGNTGYGLVVSAGTHFVHNLNTFANNGGGVAVVGNATRAAIFNNAVYDNAALGIDLLGDGVTPNDAGDADAGPNGLQNFPTDVTARIMADGKIRYRCTINTAPNALGEMYLYSSLAPDPTGYGEGRYPLLGESGVVVFPPASGNLSYSVDLSPASGLELGRWISATVESNFSTSEFSRATKVFRWGDLDGNGVVNNLDIAPFVQALTDPAAYAAAHPGIPIGPYGAGDVNDDGAFNNLDIAPFVALLTAGRGPIAPAAPERSRAAPLAPLAGDVIANEREPARIAREGVRNLPFA